MLKPNKTINELILQAKKTGKTLRETLSEEWSIPIEDIPLSVDSIREVTSDLNAYDYAYLISIGENLKLPFPFPLNN